MNIAEEYRLIHHYTADQALTRLRELDDYYYSKQHSNLKTDLFFAFIQKADPEKLNETIILNGQKAIHIAVDDVNAMKLLLAKKVDVNVTTDNRKYTALHWARKHEIVELLLNANINPDLTDYDDCTALFNAVWLRNCDDKSVALLMQHASLEDGRITPLYMAVRVNKYVTELLHLGANVNFAAKDGLTPLIIVASEGNYETAEKLIDNGADIHAATNDGDSILYVAAKYRYEKIAQLLITHGSLSFL